MAFFVFLLTYVKVMQCVDNKQYNLSEWTQGTIPSVIGRVMLSTIGYDLQHNIFIVGGISHLNYGAYDNVFIYDTRYNTFIYQEHILSEPVRTNGQSYCQINKILYIISFVERNYIHTYDMSAWTFTANAYHINTTDDIKYKEQSCLTSVGKHHLAIMGGAQGNSTTNYWDSKYFGILNLKDSSYIKGPNTHYSKDGSTCESTLTHLYAIAGGHTDTVEIIGFSMIDIAAISTKSWSVLADRLTYRVSSVRSVLRSKFIYIVGGGPTPIRSGIFHVLNTDSNRIIPLNNISIDHMASQLQDGYVSGCIGICQHMVVGTYNKIYSFGGLYIDKFLYASFLDTVDILPWEFLTSLHPSTDPTKYPTGEPTNYPSNYPSKYPSNYPSKYPTYEPTKYPSNDPSDYPSKYPSNNPYPTGEPTKYPTNYPSTIPTEYPSIQFNPLATYTKWDADSSESERNKSNTHFMLSVILGIMLCGIIVSLIIWCFCKARIERQYQRIDEKYRCQCCLKKHEDNADGEVPYVDEGQYADEGRHIVATNQ